MSEHTPGKWYSCPAQGGEAIRIECNGDGNDCKPIATLIGPDRAANGLLIAAAPDLLAACERAIGYAESILDSEGVYLDDNNDLPAIRAAVAKAKGGVA